MPPHLYIYPSSITSRPVRLFVAAKQLPITEHVVDIVTGENYREEFVAINPSAQVPVLVDGDITLTETSAILKYLASRYGAPEYPVELAQRAKVDEAMDWFNTQLARTFLFDLVYPQVLPYHRRPSEEHQRGTISWGRDKAQFWFEILDRHILGSRDYVANNRISIADYFGSAIVTAGDMIGCAFTEFPNVRRWLDTMRRLADWDAINAELCRFAAQVQGQSFVTL